MTRIAMLQRALQRAIAESHQSTAKVVAAEARLERARRAEYRAAKADRDARRASIPGAVGDQSLLQQVDGVDHSGNRAAQRVDGIVQFGLADPGELVEQPSGDDTPRADRGTSELRSWLDTLFVRHSEPPALHGLVTRHGTGVSAFRRWLQRMGWFRRSRPAARPSDTTTGGRGAR